MSEESYLRALARFDGDIKRGNIAFDYKTGQCGPVQATQLRSWGAACPSGFCTPDGLPEALGRWFAGDRAGCREIPYTIELSGLRDAAVPLLVVLAGTAPVTMCPTRIIAHAETGSTWNINVIRFGAQNQIVGAPIPSTAFATGTFAAVPIVPDCFKAGQPFEMQATLGIGGAATFHLWLTFLGPMVG